MIAAEAVKVVLPHYGYPGVIAGPPKYEFGKTFFLPPPFGIVLIDLLRTHQKDVDVAVQPPIAAGCRAKSRRMKRREVPEFEALPQTPEEL